MTLYHLFNWRAVLWLIAHTKLVVVLGTRLLANTKKKMAPNNFCPLCLRFFHNSLLALPLTNSQSHALPLPNVKLLWPMLSMTLGSLWVFIYIFMPSKVPPHTGPLKMRHRRKKHFSRYIAWWSQTVKSMCRATFPTVHLWLTPSPKHTSLLMYPYEDTALIFISRVYKISLCSKPKSFQLNPVVIKITI